MAGDSEHLFEYGQSIYQASYLWESSLGEQVLWL